MSDRPTACANCGAPRAGAFCSGCGQRFLDRRLRLRWLLGRSIEVLFDLESGLLFTLREMLRDPGGLVRRYVGGVRRRYLNPFTYLVICSSISLLLYKLVKWRTGDVFTTFVGDTSADLPPEAARFMSDLIEGMIDSSALTSALMAVPFGLLLRLFFGRRFTIAENMVFSLYTLGQSALVGGLAYLPMILFPQASYGAMTASLVTMVLTCAVGVHAGLGFFGRRLGSVVKTVLALVLSYGGIMALTVLAVVVTFTTNPRMAEGRHLPSLHRAAAEGELEKVRELLDTGTEVDQRRTETPLHLAADHGHDDLVALLLDRGAEIEARDGSGHTPLLRAVEQNRRTTVALLVERGAEADVALPDGTTALMLAAANSSRVIRSLIAAGAPLDTRRDHRLATALMIAAETGSPFRVEALLLAGADPTLTNADGETALDLARNDAIRELLARE